MSVCVCENFIPKKTVGILKKRWEQNAPDPAAERRNGLAQDVSPGSDGNWNQSRRDDTVLLTFSSCGLSLFNETAALAPEVHRPPKLANPAATAGR